MEPIQLSLLLILLAAAAAGILCSCELLPAAGANESGETETATTVTPANQGEEEPDYWEYEPRIWSLDQEQDQDGDQIGSIEPIAQLASDRDWPDGETFHNQASADLNEIGSLATELEDHDESSPRRMYHFLDSSTNRQGIYVNTTCDQFRVDIREAVVCEKKRCDKLDFEWPKYNNQLTLIASTKHGMRFHRADYAFAKKLAASDDRHQYQSSATTNSRVKFDLFELFKPKPSQPPPPTTTTAAPITTPLGPGGSTTGETPASEAPDTTTTTAPDTTTAAPSTEAPDPNLREQDSNNTQLVSTFRLDTRRRKQRIVGFGGALSDSSCKNIRSLSAEMAKSLMEDYFGDRGLRYNLARVSVGSSDFSTSPYTNNDKQPTVTTTTTSSKRSAATTKLQQQQQQPATAASDGSSPPALQDQDDIEMKNFRLTEEDYLLKMPVIRQAIATSKSRQLKLFGSLWSPPTWMKNNTNIVHGYLKGDVYGPYYKALAELMLKWLEAYRKNGIEMWAFTGLNEPITGIKPFIFHNSLGMTRDDYVTFFKLYLGPMMRQRGFQDVKLMIIDDNKGYMPNWAKTFLEDKEAARYVSGIATHWYMNDEYENLNFLSKYYPDKFILATEACNGYLPFQRHALPGDWDRGVAYMYDIIKMMHKNAVGWVDWNMALDLTGGPSWIKNYLDAAVIVNARRDEYYKSPMFYAIGHFSRFVEPDSIRLDSRLANAKYDYPLEACAFHTPNDFITIVVLNANKHSVPFRIIVDRQLIRVVTLRADSFNTIVFKWKGYSKIDT